MHVWKVLTCSRGAGLHLMKQRSRSLTLFLAAVSAGLKIQRGVWTTSIPPLYNHFLHDMHTTQVGFCDDIWCVSVLHGKKATSKKATWNPIRVIVLTWIYFFPVHRRLIFDVLSDHSISQYFTYSSLSSLAWSNRSHEWMSVVMAPTHLMDKATWEVLINFPWHRLSIERHYHRPTSFVTASLDPASMSVRNTELRWDAFQAMTMGAFISGPQ